MYAQNYTTSYYEKRLKTFRAKHPELKEKYIKTIKLLQVNPSHPSLRLHKLKGKLSDLYSASLNMQFIILLDFIIKDDHIILINIGDHDGMY